MTIITKLPLHSVASPPKRTIGVNPANDSETGKPVKKAGGFGTHPYNAYRAVVGAVGTLRQYQDIPQRFQKQWIIASLALMMLVGFVALVSASIPQRKVLIGREIQELQRTITEKLRENSDYQTRIALMLSNESLDARANSAGYVLLNQADLDYIVIPGYTKSQGVSFTSVQTAQPVIEYKLAPEYEETLFTWLARQVETASQPLGQGK